MTEKFQSYHHYCYWLCGSQVLKSVILKRRENNHNSENKITYFNPLLSLSKRKPDYFFWK